MLDKIVNQKLLNRVLKEFDVNNNLISMININSIRIRDRIIYINEEIHLLNLNFICFGESMFNYCIAL